MRRTLIASAGVGCLSLAALAAWHGPFGVAKDRPASADEVSVVPAVKQPASPGADLAGRAVLQRRRLLPA